MAQLPLHTIRVLYRQDDTMSLWGIPYDMRPGQQPRDIGQAHRGSWIWLGSPGWWGNYTAAERRQIETFLASVKDRIPQGPNEWDTIADARFGGSMAKDREVEIEREQIEWVFGLTGGELRFEPWTYEVGGKESRFPYWYEGVPDYASGDFSDQYDSGVEYRTVVTQALYGAPPERIESGSEGQIEDAGWLLQRMYHSSGETECPGRDDGDGTVTEEHTDGGDRCVLCEELLGEQHGYIYLGDGWVEAVYRIQNEEEPDGEETERASRRSR